MPQKKFWGIFILCRFQIATFVIQIFNELIQFRKSIKFNKCQVSNHSMINYLRITIIDS
jgi:hypothetical protein